jgi:hypothetical protein
MNTFETSARVGEQGRVLVAGVPFAPGTEVDITLGALARMERCLIGLAQLSSLSRIKRSRQAHSWSKR